MQAVTFFFAFVAVLALIGLAAWLVRRFATNRLGANTNRGRMPRLAVIDAAAVDGRRRLVLVRRDNIEHLIMIGGPTDIVVESTIVRAQTRDLLPQRPGVIAAELPPRLPPLPDAGRSEGEGARSEGARSEGSDHHEPQMPEPLPRPVRPSFAEEARRPLTPAPSERRSEPLRGDPLAGFAAEPLGSRPEPRPEPMPPRVTRTEPMMPRPQRSSEPPKPPPPPPVRAPERVAAPPPIPSNADQNLADMAQRLEAALRRPATGEPMAPPVAPEPPPLRPSRAETPPPPPKSGFENLEDEMASLLGRPKPSS
jgi:flagellar protein FliO/FliZ